MLLRGTCSLTLVSCLTLGCSIAPSASFGPPKEGYVTTSDQVRLHFEVAGSGVDTVVLLHGGPGLSAATYLPDLGPLLARHRVVAYDQRGGGYSSLLTDSTRLGIEAHVGDLEAVRQAIGSERLTLLAHSWGGAVAIRYALAHPSHVRRLILVDIMPPRAKPYLEQFERALFARVDSTAMHRMPEAMMQWASSGESVAGCHLHYAILRSSYPADSLTGARIHGDPCAGPPAAVRNMLVANSAGLASLGEWDWRSEVETLHVPVLLIHGDRDPMPLVSAEEWAALIPGARLAIIRGSGHFPFAERPEQFYPALEAFLEKS